jgi:protein-L-isoaspartate(D-aspartate) O-methyltransferase
MATKPLENLEFSGYRRKLIEKIQTSGIEDLGILQLFERIPRHLFLPQSMWPRAYENAPIPIGYSQTASQPSLQALYLSILKLTINDTVLEVGTGSGYLTALLALSVDRVYSVERVRELSVKARVALDGFSINNVALMVGDGTIGWRKFSPFDVIVVSAASPSIPQALIDQLGEDGRMIIPVGSRENQSLILVNRKKGNIHQEVILDSCAFVPLLGRFAWPSEHSKPGT